MHANTHMQMAAKDLSRSRERETSISGTFVRLHVLNCKRAEQSDHEERNNWDSTELSYKLRVNKTVAVAYSFVGQAVIVIIIVVSVKFEQWNISSANNKESLIKTKTNIWFYLAYY